MDFTSFFKTKDKNTTIEPVRSAQQRRETIKEEIQEITKLPRLELTCMGSRNERDCLKVNITPNSINGNIKKSERFTFGSINDNTKNDYNFPDDIIGNKHFEITYDKGK
jgi:hypothetical protein